MVIGPFDLLAKLFKLFDPLLQLFIEALFNQLQFRLLPPVK